MQISKAMLDNIYDFKSCLDNEILSLPRNVERYSFEQYSLINNISENIRMDLNYWLTCNPDVCHNGFSGVYRNIRNSIESYYDLFNLVADDTYVSILKYQSFYKKIEPVDINNIDNIYNKYKDKKTGRFTIKDKANIATLKNNLNLSIQEKLRPLSVDSNSYVHPDMYIPVTDNKNKIIKELLELDCVIFAYAFELYQILIYKKYKIIGHINVYEELNKLFNINNSIITLIF